MFVLKWLTPSADTVEKLKAIMGGLTVELQCAIRTQVLKPLRHQMTDEDIDNIPNVYLKELVDEIVAGENNYKAVAKLGSCSFNIRTNVQNSPLESVRVYKLQINITSPYRHRD